jgi:hypothetical protein
LNRCLTTGLPRDATIHDTTNTFDESAYRHYENVRERLVELFEDVSIQYMRTPFIGKQEEVCSIGFCFLNIILFLIDRMY